jgi:hypothetical protein
LLPAWKSEKETSKYILNRKAWLCEGLQMIEKMWYKNHPKLGKVWRPVIPAIWGGWDWEDHSLWPAWTKN